MKKTIYLADCHQLVLDGLLFCISNFENLEVTGYSTDCESFFTNFQKNPTDVVILDVHLSQIKSPLEIISFILKVNPQCDILVMSYLNSISNIRGYFNYGIKGYIDKSEGFESIKRALMKFKNGEMYLCNQIKNEILNEAMGVDSQINLTNEVIKKLEAITTREMEVLLLICNEYKTEEISNKLNISTHTVNTYRKNLLRKINAKNTVGLVKYALANEII